MHTLTCTLLRPEEMHVLLVKRSPGARQSNIKAIVWLKPRPVQQYFRQTRTHIHTHACLYVPVSLLCPPPCRRGSAWTCGKRPRCSSVLFFSTLLSRYPSLTDDGLHLRWCCEIWFFFFLFFFFPPSASDLLQPSTHGALAATLTAERGARGISNGTFSLGVHWAVKEMHRGEMSHMAPV